TVFGYGISAFTPADRFTFGGSTNQAPTVATPASASPNPVTGTTTTLNVQGADDGGADKLTYTWTVSGPAAVAFSDNGTNSASSTQSGTYNFVATITDAGGLGVTSNVSVTVTVPNQAPTIVTPASASPNPVTAKTTNLSVLGDDDGGAANLRYTWSVLDMPPGA